MRSKRIVIGALIAALVLTAAINFGAQQQNDVDRQLKAAMNTELVDGNLKAAIEEYKKVAESGIRPLAAQALFHMAECYRKLGENESRAVYERIVREYPDQKEAAALASARLAGSSQPLQTSTLAWSAASPTVDPSEGHISADGRYLSFIEWETGDLCIHDMITGANRNLTNQRAGKKYRLFAEESAFSRDGKRIAFSWGNEDDNVAELRLGNVTGEFSPRTVYKSPEVRWLSIFDWSPDDRLLAVQIQRQDFTREIGVLSLSDGSLHLLKSLDWRGAAGLRFSPDAKYIAYDTPQVDSRQVRDVFVISVDGAKDLRVAETSATIGWSHDGKWLLFTSDRTGSTSLWGVPFANGKTQGTAQLLLQGLPQQGVPIGVTNAGKVYYYRYPAPTTSDKLSMASFDFETGRFLSAPKEILRDPSVSLTAIAWRPDGTHFSYLATSRTRGKPPVLTIRSTDIPEIREILPKMGWFDEGDWSRDGRLYLTRGQDLKGRSGVFEIDAQNGDAIPLALDHDGEANMYPKWGPDEKTIYFPRLNDTTRERAIIQRNLETGAERVLFRTRQNGGGLISPDGRYTIVPSEDTAANARTLLLISIADDVVRELIRMPTGAAPEELMSPAVGMFFSGVTWAPDSRSFLVWKKAEATKAVPTFQQLWQVFIDGTPAREIQSPPAVRPRPFWISPDGRRVILPYSETRPRENGEVWAIDHFLPASMPK